VKRRDVLLTCLGSSCIISGLSIFGFYSYYSNKMENTIQENIDKSTIYVSNTETSDVTENSNSTLVDTTVAVENVDEDQVIKEVKTYSNVLSIPELGILAYINDGVSKDALAGGVGRHEETANIGELGNCVVAGHASDIYNCILNNLDKINLFDSFEVYDSSGKKHTYYVTQKFICEPDDVGILASSTMDKSMFTIYTCTNKGSQRLVVEGTELTEAELAKYKENLHNTYVTNMLNFNESYNIEAVYTELQVRELAKNRHYSVNYVKSNKVLTPIVTNLYGVAPQLKQVSTDIGFNIVNELGGKK
jgi:sortase A